MGGSYSMTRRWRGQKPRHWISATSIYTGERTQRDSDARDMCKTIRRFLLSA